LAAVLGRYEETEVYFSKSAAFCREAKAHFYALRTELWWSTLLMRRQASGDRDRATLLLISAQQAAAAAGYRAMKQSAAQSLSLAQAQAAG
jgi:hypothetical protein